MEEKELVLKRAQNAVISRDFPLAARLYSSLLDADPQNQKLLAAMGNLYVKSGEDEKALPYFQKILSASPDDVDAMNRTGGIFRRLKRYDDAVRILNRALQFNKDTAEINYTLGFTYKSMGRIREATDCFEQVVAQNPRDVLAYNHLGAIYAQQKEYGKSISAYRRGLQADPNHPILQYNLAKSCEAVRDDSGALAAYETALRARPGWTDALTAYTELLLRLSRTKTAMETIKNGIALSPHDAHLQMLRGKILLAQNDESAAAAALEEAASLNPDSAALWALLADAYEKTGALEKATDAIRSAERKSETDAATHLAVRKQAVEIALSAGAFDDASRRLKELAAESKRNAELLALGGQYYICKLNDSTVRLCREKIKKIRPSYTDFLYGWAKRYFQRGDAANARAVCDEYLSLHPQSIPALLLRGKICLSLNDPAAAREAFDKILAIDSCNAAAATFIAELNAAQQPEQISQSKIQSEPPEVPAAEPETAPADNAPEPPEQEEPSEQPPFKPEEDGTPDEPEDSLLAILDDDEQSIFDLDDTVTPEDTDDTLLEKSLLEDEPEADSAQSDTIESADAAQQNSAAQSSPSSAVSDAAARAEEPDTPPRLQSNNPPTSEPAVFSGYEAGKLAATMERAAQQMQQAAQSAEKAWKSVQLSEDAIQERMNKLAEDAAKAAAKAAEQKQDDRARSRQNSPDEADSADGAKQDKTAAQYAAASAPAAAQPETAAAPIADASAPETAARSGQDSARPPQASDAGTRYNELLAHVSQALPIINRMLENPDAAQKFDREITLFKKLNALGDTLPEQQRAQFKTGRMRLLLDYLIARLSGKPGLLKTSHSLRKSGVLDDFASENTPESENLSGRALLDKVLADMETLAAGLEDKELSQALVNSAKSISDKLN